MVRRLRRNRRKALLGGVAAGLGDYFDVDPVLVRLGFVLLTFATGIGLLFYFVCWLIMPSDKDPVADRPAPGETVAEEVRAVGQRVYNEVRQAGESGRAQLIVGGALVLVGVMLLADEVSWMFAWPYWLRFENLWPLILVAIGLGLLLRSREEET